MRARLNLVLLACAVAVSSGRAAAAVPIPEPLPEGCDHSTIEGLRLLLAEIFSESPIAPKPSRTDDRCPMSNYCSSSTELTAKVRDDRAKMLLARKFRGVRTARFGDSLYIDLAGLRGRPKELVGALCAIAPLVRDLRLSAGVAAETSEKDDLPPSEVATTTAIGPTSYGDNSKWLGEINALPAGKIQSSALTVAVIDGMVRDDHEDLPEIKHWVVSDGANGRRRRGAVCCKPDPQRVVNPYLPHTAWTIGTIAAKQDNDKGIDGLSKPGAILAIDPGGGTCRTMWKMASAIECAVKKGAQVVLYAAEPMAGDDMEATFASAVQKVVDAKALLVFPAGNSYRNLDTCPAWPASFNNANTLTVTQVAEDGELGAMTGFGRDTVDLGVRLEHVDTTTNESTNTYDDYDRTSAASAIVTGSLLQVSGHANYKKCTVVQLRQLLLDAAETPANSDVAATISPHGGYLKLPYPSAVELDSQGQPVDYCAGMP